MTSLRTFLLDKGYLRIKLSATPTGHFKFNIKLNDVSGSFILDTGASNTCVDLTSVEQFDLFAEDCEIKAAGAGAIDMMTQLSSKNKISIKDWEVDDIDVILFDLSHVNAALTNHDQEPVDGIVGADILDRGKAIIDYQYHCLYLK